MPKLLRKLDWTVQKYTGKSLPPEFSNLTFGSWMGGDRDGAFPPAPDSLHFLHSARAHDVMPSHA